MEASWKCEGALAVKSPEGSSEAGEEATWQLQGPGRGQQKGWVAQGASQGVEDTQTGQIYPLKLLSTARGHRTGLGKSGPNQT